MSHGQGSGDEGNGSGPADQAPGFLPGFGGMFGPQVGAAGGQAGAPQGGGPVPPFVHVPASTPSPGGGLPSRQGGSFVAPGGRGGGPLSPVGTPNVGLVRRTGRKRVIGGQVAVVSVSRGVTKSYVTANTVQFNDVEEMRSDAISRLFAQEILESLWGRWRLDTSNPAVMRKAEDLIWSLIVMRTASPDADYNLYITVGGLEVNLVDFSNILAENEVTRRRFSRAVADDIRGYIEDPDNGKLRSMLSSELGVKPEYVKLAFDGSTHCSGLVPNQVMFAKQLERMNLFDQQETRDKLGSNRSLLTGGFQANRVRGAYDQ